MNFKTKQITIVFIEVVIFVSILSLASFWYLYPKGNYEPLIVIFSTMFVVTEGYRRHLKRIFDQEFTKNINSDNSKKNDFSRLIDSHRKSLSSATFIINSDRYDNILAIEKISKQIRKTLEEKILRTARQHICETDPNDLEPAIFSDLLKARNGILPVDVSEAMYGSRQEQINKLKQKLEELNFNDCWEYIKDYLGSDGTTDTEKLKILEYISTRNFYKFSYENRLADYNSSFNSVYHVYGSTFQIHLKSIFNMIKFLNNNKSHVQEYLSLLSKHEIILIFYFMMSEKITCEDYMLAYDVHIIDDIYITSKYSKEMIDLGNSKIIENDLVKKYAFCSEQTHQI